MLAGRLLKATQLLFETKYLVGFVNADDCQLLSKVNDPNSCIIA